MAKATKPQPLLKTPEDQLGKTELIKRDANMAQGNLHDDFRDLSDDSVENASEQVAKSHGIYLEYNRAKTGREKDWMYMVRISVPGGGSFNREQWAMLDELSDKYTINPNGSPSLRVTTRQNIQFHWVKKKHIVDIVSGIARTGFFTLNGCGDNARNVMGCPLSKFSTIYDANAWAHKVGAYFRLPAEAHIQVFEIDTSLISTPDQHYSYGPQLFNRKFKMAFSAVHQNETTGEIEHDNCVELRTNEIGVAPIVEHGKVVAYHAYIGGGQGEKNGKPTFAALGKPFGVFDEENLLPGLDAIATVHSEWGDRKNRHWARMKYVVEAKGIPWFQEQVKARGVDFEQPIPDFDPGPRMMHHGWQKQPSNGLWAFGAYLENGRIINGENGRLKDMVRHMMDSYDIEIMTTPNQDVLFTNVPEDAKADFEAAMKPFGFGQRNGKAYSKLRVLSGACVALPTCRLATAESELFEPELIDTLDKMGYGDVAESIGITGCERQCFRPATKTIGWIGHGPDIYGIKLGGSEDARHQGQWLVEDDKWYLKQVPRDQVAVVCAALFDFHKASAQNGEDLGALLRRVGAVGVIEALRNNPTTAHLLEKTYDAPYVPEPLGCVTV